ncbi:agmatinase family protein [Nitriliruptor alkaliphilus]|uniref:agmatinase family protein n=1 Tax=Nitriliruptor alkaliphilus TaxID=427918 RepID=UPI0006966408|nr:agmatinase family protein [Nitriliruptor alkaliphilus]
MTTDPDWTRAATWLARHDADPALEVLGLPTSSASISPSEAWRTPAAVRGVLARFSTFDGERGIDLEELPVRDLGDLDLARLPTAEALTAIDAAVAGLATDPVHVFLGGDNVVTAPIVAAHPAAPIERFGVLTFDAHHDVRAYDEVPSNGAPIRWLLDHGLPGDQVVQIGIHGHANGAGYRRYCDEQGIRVVTVAEVERRGIEVVVDEALDDLAARTDAVHVDLDIDVLDRSFVPGCPGARPGGLTPRQLTAAAHRCGAHPAVRSLDLVEVDAAADVAELTVMNLAAVFLAVATGVATRR